MSKRKLENIETTKSERHVIKKVKYDPNVKIKKFNFITREISSWIFQGQIITMSKLREVMMYKKLTYVLNFDIADESGTIRCTAYDNVAKSLEAVIKTGLIIQVRKANIKPANKNFNNTGNLYELEITENTIIRELTDNPPGNFDVTNKISYMKFSDIDDVLVSSAYNVIGIVKKVGEPMPINTQAKKLLVKRNVTLIDECKNTIIVTAWGDLATELTWKKRDIVSLQGVGINEYNGMRNIKLYSSTIININDNTDESKKLRDVSESVMPT